MRLFTKKFFRLCKSDQQAIVSSIMYDLEKTIWDLDDEEIDKVEQQIRRIRHRAIKHGVWSDEK